MIDKSILEQVSKSLGIPLDVTTEAYNSFWEFVRSSIEDLPLKEDLSEEQFNQLQTNFNIPSIGKLYCTYDRYKGIKDRYKYIKELRDDPNNKESKTSI